MQSLDRVDIYGISHGHQGILLRGTRADRFPRRAPQVLRDDPINIDAV